VDVLHERCAGVDISKKDAKVCVRTPAARRRGSFTTATTTWGSTTNQVLALRDHLLAANVTLVVLEATSDYWKPFYYLLAQDLNVILVNARQVKNLPGRKTDVSDAAWLAQLGAHGLVRPSFVPRQPIRELRDLTRARTQLTRERGQVVQRLEKLLEDAGIKLAAVALRHHGRLKAGPCSNPHPRGTRPAHPGPDGQTPDARQDPRAGRGPDRTLR
jgi:transposase